MLYADREYFNADRFQEMRNSLFQQKEVIRFTSEVRLETIQEAKPNFKRRSKEFLRKAIILLTSGRPTI
jgi:hypothetical protein